jgi:hypothetical protein
VLTLTFISSVWTGTEKTLGKYVRFEVSTAVTMMIIIFWEMTPCGSYKNRRFGGSYRLHLQGEGVRAGTERSSKLLYRQRLVEPRGVIIITWKIFY